MSHYIIFGYGGIGAAVAKRIDKSAHQVTVVTRQKEVSEEGIKFISMSDLDDALANNTPDYVINTIGVLHDEHHQPEKNIDQLNEEWLTQSMRVNVMPTIQIAQALKKVMNRKSAVKMLSISARVSSIDDNKLGGWYSYRMSKITLNMLIKNLSIEWARAYPDSAIIAYHPGTVDTPLSAPFHSNIPENQIMPAEQAAEYLLEQLHAIGKEDSGKLIDYQGKAIPA